MKTFRLAVLAAVILLPASAFAQPEPIDPANLHINGPGGFAQSSGGTDWVTLPTFNGLFNINDVANNGEVVSPWHLVVAIPNFTGAITDNITMIGTTSVNIVNDKETTLLAGQDAYVQLGVPGTGLPNSLSFTNFALADKAVIGLPTPTSYGMYDFTVSPLALAVIANGVPDNVQLGGNLPAGSILFAWGLDQNGTTISTAFTNAGVITQQAFAVPEPSTLIMSLIGMVGFVTFIRRSLRGVD